MRHYGEREQEELLTFRSFLCICYCGSFPSLVGIEGHSVGCSPSCLAGAVSSLRLQVCSCHLFLSIFSGAPQV